MTVNMSVHMDLHILYFFAKVSEIKILLQNNCTPFKNLTFSTLSLEFIKLMFSFYYRNYILLFVNSEFLNKLYLFFSHTSWSQIVHPPRLLLLLPSSLSRLTTLASPHLQNIYPFSTWEKNTSSWENNWTH